MHVALATDRAYLPWCATAILSCLEANGLDYLHAHVLHLGDLQAPDASRLAAMVGDRDAQIELHAIDPARLANLPSKGAGLGGHISWARVALADTLAGLDRVIYLDADVLVTASMADLWSWPLCGAPLAAVANVVEPAMHHHVASLGIPDPTRYFNAGVLLVDLRRWREEGCGEQLARFVLSRRESLPWFDQDALNAVFAGRWEPLSPRWNAQNSLWVWPVWAEEVFGAEALHEATTSPAILHFEGPSLNKPWHYLCSHPWREEYRRTLAETPWSGTALLDRTPATMAIARLAPEAQLHAYLRLERWRRRGRAGLRRARSFACRMSRRRLIPGSEGGADTTRRWKPGRRRG